MITKFIHCKSLLAVLTTTAAILLTAGASADTLDLSPNFDDASDFSPLTVVHTTSGVISSTNISNQGTDVLFQTIRTSGGNGFASTFSTATYNPSTQGILNSIDWSTTISDNGNIEGQEPGQMMPLLSQNGTLFVYKGGGVVPNNALAGNTFYNFTSGAGTFLDQAIVDALASDFEALSTSPYGYAGGAGGGPTALVGVNPDFSASGGEITFGFLAINADSGARNNSSVLRNTAVMLDFTPAAVAPVPEPASLLVWGLLAAIAVRFAKRRK